jgi:hypothetical protein
MSEKKVPDILTFIFVGFLGFYFTGSMIHHYNFSASGLPYGIIFLLVWGACMFTMIVTFKHAFFVEKQDTMYSTMKKDFLALISKIKKTRVKN